MSFPYTLSNDMRIYDQCFYDWLGLLKVNYGSIAGVPRQNFGILRVFSTPHRAVSEMENLLVRKGWLDQYNPGIGDGEDTAALETWHRIPLPFVSIYRQAPTIDEARFMRGGIRNLTYSNDLLSGTSTRTPLPINIPYQLDFWFKRKFSEAHVMEFVLSQMGDYGNGHNEFFRTVTIGSGWGDKIIPIRLESFSDNSELEPGESNRTLRMTVDFTLRGWLFFPITSTGDDNELVITPIKEEHDYNAA